MRKLLFGLLGAFMLIGVGSFADSDTIRVSREGKLNSISTAIQQAKDGDVILISPGIYDEQEVVVDKSVSIIGIDYPVLEGAGKKHDVLIVKHDSVIINGLRIRNVQTDYIRDLSAINVQANHCIVENNRLDNTFFGIYLQKCRGNIVRNNIVEGEAKNEISSGNAVHLWYCQNTSVINNSFKNHRDGIYLEFSDSIEITNNVSEGNLRYGLHFMFSNHNVYSGNTFKSNGAGVAVMFSRHIIMKNNDFTSNWGSASYGLLLKEIYDGEITGNRFTSNTIGIYGESANRLIVADNDFERNGWALRILGSCADNTFTHNNFIGNSFDLGTNASQKTNVYKNNFWASYSGYDLNHDGVGDVPYKPVNLFSYLVERIPQSILLHRGMFIQVLNYAEKVAPIFTPEDLADNAPLMKKIKR